MHRGTTSIYRRVTMAASSGTKKICLIAVTGKPGTAYLPKSFWCAARRMYSRRIFPSVSHRPTVLLRETLHRYLFPVIASCGVFYTCKAHLSRGFYKKVKIIFSQAFVSQQHNAHLFKNFPTYHPLVRKGRNKSKSPISPCPFFGFIADLFHKSLGEIADIGRV